MTQESIAIEERAPSGASTAPAGELPGVISALGWGLASAWAARRILILIAGCNLALAALVLFPLYGSIDASLSHHPEAGRLGRDFDYRWWTDWANDQASAVASSINLLGAAGSISVVLSAFFAGGLLEALRSGPKPRLQLEPMPDPLYRGATPEWRAAAPGPGSVQIFLRESARHFPLFLLLLAFSIPLYWGAQKALNYGALIELDGIQEGINDERLGLLLAVLRAIAFVGAFHLVTVVFEYARARAVLQPGASLLDLFALPAALFRTRPLALLGVEAASFLMQVGAMLAFIPVDRLLARWPVVAATAGFAAAQIFLLVRLLIRAGAQGAQIRLAQAWLSRRG